MNGLRRLPLPWWAALAFALALGTPASWAARDLVALARADGARELSRAGDHAAALARLRPAVAAQPHDARLALALANALQAQWRAEPAPALWGEMHRWYARAASLNPNWAVPHAERARLFAGQGDFGAALMHLEQALLRDPDAAPYWLDRGRYLERLGRHGGALSSFLGCLERDSLDACREGVRRWQERP